MKQHRFFVKENIEQGGNVILRDPDIIHQIKDVLRLRLGASVVLLDNKSTEFHGELELISKGEIRINEILMKKVSNNSKIKMNLYFSMIKKDKAEWILQKCTEIGVSEFHPVISDRTEKINLNIERAEKIIREASEQSERVDLPKLYEAVSLEKALAEVQPPIVALHINGEKIDVSQHRGSTSAISVFVGPEGGWSETDLDLFKKHNVKLVSIGQNVLRAETASVAVTSLILLNII